MKLFHGWSEKKEAKLPHVTRAILPTVASFRTWRGLEASRCMGLDLNILTPNYELKDNYQIS